MGTGSKSLRLRALALALVLSAFPFPAAVLAADWEGNESTDWDDTDNWSGGTAPTNGSDIHIDHAEADPPFSPVITSVTTNTNLPASNIWVGNTGGSASVLSVSGGGVLHIQSGTIGDGAGSDGTVIVTGAGSTWEVTGDLSIAHEGTGTLIVENGGMVSSGSGTIAGYPGSTGMATVTGENSVWETGDLFVGFYGTGTLDIADGGSVKGTDSRIGGINTHGTVTVTGENSSWEVDGELLVGWYGTGSLTIADGGLVGATGVVIADSSLATGTLAIGAAAGETAVAPGTLDTPKLTFGDGPGTLIFNHTDMTGDYAFAADIVSGGGSASIEHHAGYTRLTGDGSGFGGTTTVDGGALAVENMLGGAVDVLDGGALGGSGQIKGMVTIGNGGVLAPGSSIGALNVVGDVTQETGSTFVVEVDNLGNGDLLDVTGSYTIQTGTTLAIQPENGTDDGSTYPKLTEYTIVTASGGVTGTFDTVTEDFLFLDAILYYDPNAILLALEQNYDFVDAAVTPNQMHIAGALDGLPFDNPLRETIIFIRDDETAIDAFDQLYGEIHASLKGALIENGQQAVRAVNDRIHDAFDASEAGTSIAAYGETVDPAGGFWLTGYGDWMTTDATGNTHEFDNDLYGVMAGIDHRLGDYGRLGLLGGYSRTNTSIEALASEADANSYTLGVYGGADNGRAGLSLGALYTWHSIDSSRYVTNPATEMLEADYDARSLQLFAEAGYKARMEGFSVEPFAGVSYIDLQTDAFSETGGIAALSSPSQATSTTFATLGLRMSAEVARMATLRGMVGWRHAFGDVDPASTSTIAGSAPFSITGAPIAEDAAVVEAGIDIEASDNFTIGASYQGQFGHGAIANGFNARLVAAF
ncbi:autotransporter domain-containing protein [Hoeflea sp. CAU 1731]